MANKLYSRSKAIHGVASELKEVLKQAKAQSAAVHLPGIVKRDMCTQTDPQLGLKGMRSDAMYEEARISPYLLEWIHAATLGADRWK